MYWDTRILKKTLYRYVENEYKVDLKNIEKEVGDPRSPTLLSSQHLNNFTYNEGKAVYLTEPGLYQLIMQSHVREI